MNVLFLGTAAGKPSNHRNVTSIAVILKNAEFILVDCGEATQHQLMKSSLRMSKLKEIFITHIHGDHVFGLPGLLCTLNEIRDEPLVIHGPPGIKSFLDSILRFSHIQFKIHIYEMKNKFSAIISSIKSGTYNYTVQSCQVLHGVKCFAFKITQFRDDMKVDKIKILKDIDNYRSEIESLGFKPVERLISYLKSNDEVTMSNGFVFSAKNYEIKEEPCSVIIALDNYDCTIMISQFKYANMLVHECTYAIFPDMSPQETRVIEINACNHEHSTNVMATKVAEALNVNTLILTHFSNRYDFTDEENIIAGCKPINTSLNIKCARDFSEFYICNK